MQPMKIMLGLLLAGILTAQAEDVVIQSYDRAGKVTFTAISNVTGYRVEWAGTLAGPWTNFTEAAAWLDHIPGYSSGVVTCAVPMVYRVVAMVTNPPADMVLIPAGSFVMGNATNVFPADEGDASELPQHPVAVSAFYMGRYEVTKAQWDAVYAWATVNGYSFNNAGSGKALDHPVQSVSWYDVVKWCNARSQKEGLTPCYTVGGVTYKSGKSTPECNWTARGYRLPTEAEWEYAARGGAANHRFPWSDADTIQQARANYISYWPSGHPNYAYDTNPTEGYHPAYTNGGMPYTSPVGAFAANGFGLYDMAGNAREWCWDWHDWSYYATSPGTDPRGPATGAFRVIRGGAWGSYAYHCRVAYRNAGLPDENSYSIGFRVVLLPEPVK